MKRTQECRVFRRPLPKVASDNPPDIALEGAASVARGRRRKAVGGDHRQHDRSRDRLVVREFDQLALAARLEEKPSAVDSAAFRRSRDSSLSPGL